jgi:hypothetical protein
MTEPISVPQTSENAENCDRKLLIYEAIRYQISQSYFSRIQIDEEELLHVLFFKLIDMVLPPFGSEELTELLRQKIRHTIRDFKLAKRSSLDVDEVDPDDGPFYDNRKKDFETEFEEAFDRFCDSCEEPQRTIYRRFRVCPQTEISRITKLSRDEIRISLKAMPKKFQEFLKNFCY